MRIEGFEVKALRDGDALIVIPGFERGDEWRWVALPEKKLKWEFPARGLMVYCAPRHLWRDMRGWSPYKMERYSRRGRNSRVRWIRLKPMPDGDTITNKKWGKPWSHLRRWWKARHKKYRNKWGAKFFRVKSIRGVTRYP